MFRFSRFLFPVVFVFLIFCFSFSVFADESSSETIQTLVTNDVIETEKEVTSAQDNQQLIVDRLDLIYTAILFFVFVFVGSFVCFILYKLLDSFLTF